MELNEEERKSLFNEKYGNLDIFTSYVSFSQYPTEKTDDGDIKFIGESILEIEAYDQPFQINFSVGLNGSFLPHIQQIFFNIEFQSNSRNIVYDQVEKQLIVSREQIATSPISPQGVIQLNGEIPNMVAPTRGYFTVNFIFEVDDPELDENNPTLIGYSVCRVPVQVPSGKQHG